MKINCENFIGSEFVRILAETDFARYRRLRLEALELDGRFFASSYVEEKNYTDNQWKRLSAERPDNCVIGLFSGDKMIGMTRVIRWDEDPLGQTVLFGRSYIKPEYRGRGLASLLYEARLEWARRIPNVKSAVVFHRVGNTTSKHINEKNGAKYWLTRPMQWADGETADGLWYRVPLFEFGVVIRPLTADDSEAYQALRKRILDIGDGRYFSASYRRDKTFVTEAQWRGWCTETHEHCVMGTFFDGELVGIMTAIAQEPVEHLTAEWDSVWLDLKYRQCGIARLSYKKLEKWTRDNGYKYVETFVRADNHRVLGIRKKLGSIHTHTKRNEIWADGSVGDAYFFKIVLDQANSETPYDQATNQLGAMLDFLKPDQPENVKEVVGRSKMATDE